MIGTEECCPRNNVSMNIPLLLCLLTISPGLILNTTFIFCIKSPRSTINAVDLTILLKTVHYIVVFSYLLVVETVIWSKEILYHNGETMLTGISEILVDTLPVTTFVLAIIRIVIFSNTGGSLRKVKRSTATILYSSCLLFVFICSVIVHISCFDGKYDGLSDMLTNATGQGKTDDLRYAGVHYFTVYITPFIGSGMLYLSIILKMRNCALNLSAHQESFTVQTPRKMSSIKAVSRSLISYMAMFLLLWVPYISCQLYKRSAGNTYVVESIEMALIGSIFFWNPIADGMFLASRRKYLLSYIRNSLHMAGRTNEDNPQLSVIPLQDAHTQRGTTSRSSCNTNISKQTLYERRRGNVSTTPHISITNTPTQIIMLTTPPMDNFHLSPPGSFELLSPIFYRREEGLPPRSMSFQTSQSEECLIESISFRSSLLSMDQGAYTSTPGSFQAASCPPNRRISVLRCARSRSASVGNRILRSSVTGYSYPSTSISSHRSQRMFGLNDDK